MTKQNFTTPIKADDGKASSLSGPFPLFSLVFDRHHQHLKLQTSAKATHFHCHRSLSAAMDFDCRASSIHSARHLSAVQAARLHSVSELQAAELESSINMTICMESESDSQEEHRLRLVEKSLQYQQSVDRPVSQLVLMSDKSQSFHFTISTRPGRLCGRETENRTAALIVDFRDEDDEDDDDNEKPEDGPNSDEDNYSVFYESDGDDDARTYFPCPFCYVEIEIPMLCSHLQEEHCFDLKNAVCPLCAANLGKDPIGHFITQHSSSLKRRRKPDKSTIRSGSSAMLRKKLVTNGRGNKHESTPDPLLSPFICNVSVPDPNIVHQNEDNALVISDAKSAGTDARDVGNEEDHQERRQRAAFVQQLVASTIL